MERIVCAPTRQEEGLLSGRIVMDFVLVVDDM